MYRLDPTPVGDAGHGAREGILLGEVMLRQPRAAHRRHADVVLMDQPNRHGFERSYGRANKRHHRALSRTLPTRCR